MKCPTCGAPNKSTNKACYRCGQVLDDRSVQPKGTASSLWYNAAEKKDRQAPPPFWSDTSGRPTYEEKSDFIVLHDEEADDDASHAGRAAPAPDNRVKLGRADGRREVSVVVPPPARRQFREEAPGRARRYRIRWRRLVFAAMAILILSVGVGYGVFLLYRVAVGAASQLFANSRDSAAGQTPRVDLVMIDGAGWHKITFYGKDGDEVLVTDPKRSIPVQNGEAVLMLEDQNYISADLTADKVTVSLEATLVSPDGKTTPILVPPYVIDVPLAPLKIILPAQQDNLSTDCDSIYVKIKVMPGSNRVMIGDTNVTDAISADGYASTTVALKPNMLNTITISADTADYRKNVQELKVDRPVMQVQILLDDPDSTTLTNVTSTSNPTIKIKGTTVANATVTTNASNGVNITKSTGSFNFTATLKAWGWNDITVTATTADGQTSTLTHRVNHIALDPYYSSHAQLMTDTDYAYLLAHTKAVTGRIYCLTGTVASKIDSEDADYYVFNAGTSGDSWNFVLENTTDADIKVGQAYKVFVDVDGTSQQNDPVVVLRQSYWISEVKAPGASASPGAPTSPGASAVPGASPSPTASASN